MSRSLGRTDGREKEPLIARRPADDGGDDGGDDNADDNADDNPAAAPCAARSRRTIEGSQQGLRTSGSQVVQELITVKEAPDGACTGVACQ